MSSVDSTGIAIKKSVRLVKYFRHPGRCQLTPARLTPRMKESCNSFHSKFMQKEKPANPEP